MPNVLSPRDLVSRPDNMDETVLHLVKRFGRRNALNMVGRQGITGLLHYRSPCEQLGSCELNKKRVLCAFSSRLMIVPANSLLHELSL